MSILSILIYPDENLRKKAELVSDKENLNEINIFVKNMFDTMYYYNGIGLSATQVNIHKQIITIDIDNNKIVLINPIIKNKKGYVSFCEGCLSIPNFFLNIIRYKNIEIEYLDIDLKKKKLKASNILSSCIQHEIDHLYGILIIDHLKKNK
ncbi:peptide deformylase [endosymbiont of Euscepes postfasciatus]|uniref:peptide deformylase n=1 Tax=endosymbiont of Euscepes postfasciatus TaxID=650377 RepID=UPI000DC723A1|nr:peptide deformylase [endosymbiont of Euscepes postfasciatus]BBA84666.1 peptide deformylase [endosymbiont of Euscepes postfasciatus]